MGQASRKGKREGKNQQKLVEELELRLVLSQTAPAGIDAAAALQLMQSAKAATSTSLLLPTSSQSSVATKSLVTGSSSAQQTSSSVTTAPTANGGWVKVTGTTSTSTPTSSKRATNPVVIATTTIQGTLSTNQPLSLQTVPVVPEAAAVRVTVVVSYPSAPGTLATDTSVVVGMSSNSQLSVVPNQQSRVTTLVPAGTGSDRSLTVGVLRNSALTLLGVPSARPAMDEQPRPQTSTAVSKPLPVTSTDSDSTTDTHPFDPAPSAMLPATDDESALNSDASAVAASAETGGAMPALQYTIQVEQLAFDVDPVATYPVSMSTPQGAVSVAAGYVPAGTYASFASDALFADRITAGSSSLGTSDSTTVLQQDVALGDGVAGALPLRSSGPIAGKLTEGPTTRTVDLRDALALELAWLLMESGLDDVDQRAAHDSNVTTIEVAIPGAEAQVPKPTERLANGLVLVGVDWPPTPHQIATSAPVPLIGVEVTPGTQSPANSPSDEAEALAAELQKEQAERKSETEERNQALRTGLTIAYGLAFMFLLPDLTSFFQSRRRARRGRASRDRSWTPSWPRRSRARIS